MTDEEVRALVDDPELRRDVSAVELTRVFLGRLEEAQPRLRAMITITPELALAAARDVDVGRVRGERRPLDGLTVVLKDNVDVARVPTTVGSRLFAGRAAPGADAAVTARLRAAGAVILGKANMHELAFGGTSLNDAYGHVVNPAAPDRIAGGSSGGSGAAVSADLCIAAIGTDTGGSVRLPAALCGISGIRPTYGAVSNRGVQPVSVSFDTVGPLARSVADVRAVLAAIAGFDPDDPYSLGAALDLGGADAVEGLRVAVAESLVSRSDPAVASCVRAVAAVFEELGAIRSEVELTGWEEAVELCGRLIKGEARAVYRDALAERPGLMEEGTRQRLELGEELGPADVDALRRERARWTATFVRALGGADVLLLPTTPVDSPPAYGADTLGTTAAVVPYTHFLSFAHVPSLSIPCGTTAAGAPVGAMLAAAPWRDGLVLRAGAAVQRVTDWHRRRPV